MSGMSEEAIGHLRAMIGEKEPGKVSDGPSFDMDRYLTGYNVSFRKEVNGETIKYIVQCPFNEDHKGKDAAAFVKADGTLSFHCFHDSCSDNHWADYRRAISGDEDLSRFWKGGKKPEGKHLDQDIDPLSFFKTGRELQELDVHVDWIIEGIIPEGALTDLIGPTGWGKTILYLNMADAITKGESWLGRATKQVPCYILDYENPLPVNAERARTLGLEEVLFWHSSSGVVKIDSKDYEILKRLPPGLIFVDSHRASQSGDENSSKDVGLVMERWKELRDLGFTIVLVHHTQKANTELFRGSQALIDQCDHCLYFYPVKEPGAEDQMEVKNPDTATYFLGTKGKTRFENSRLYLKRAPGYRFEIAASPEDEKLSRMATLLSDKGTLKQQDFLKAIKEDFGISKNIGLRLLEAGVTKELWKVEKGEKNSCWYSVFPFSSPKGEGKTGKQKSGSFSVFSGHDKKNGNNSIENAEFSHDFGPVGKTGKQNNYNTRRTGEPCRCCGERNYWLSVHDAVVCGTCHPPAPGALKQWIAQPEEVKHG